MAELGVFGVGVATADAELRTVGDNGTSLCTVNLAFNRSFKTKDDKWQNEPCFIKAQVWGSRADKMAELVKKGQPIYVAGYLKQDSWEDKKTGQKRVSYSMTVRDFQLCERNSKKNNGSVPTSDSSPQSNNAVEPEQTPETNDDIPF